MKAEFSNYGFINAERYTSLHLQEGRMVTDRDEMGSKTMLQAAQQALGSATFRNGVPKRGGLLTDFSQSTARLASEGGTVVAGGLVAKIEPRSEGQELSFRNQRDLPEMGFEPGYLYVDIFKDSISALEDPDLLEVALNGADTSIAERMYSQIKCCKIDAVIESDCGSVFDSTKMPEIGSGEFSITRRDATSSPDECDPCAAEVTVDQDVLNALFRMEVHSVDYDALGTPLKVTVKWSYENAGMIFPPSATQDIHDPNFSFEYFDSDTQSLMGIPAQGYGPAGAMRIVHGSDPSPTVTSQTLVRRLDGFAVINLVTSEVTGWDKDQELNSLNGSRGVTKGPGGYVFDLETVIVTLNLDDKAILTGDYWLALMRSGTVLEADAVRALSTLPMGIKHEYCLLGYSEDGVNIEINRADLSRLQSPDLSCLHAQSIHYTALEGCGYADGATNVEEALNAFCGHIGQLYEEVAAPVPPPTTYPHIKSIRWAGGAVFKNDWPAYKDWVEAGFILEFSEPMQIDYISDDVVTLVVDMPRTLPVSANNQSLLSSTITPVIIPGVVTPSGGSQEKMLFVPDAEILGNIYSEMMAVIESDYDMPIRMRIAVNGRFLFSELDNRQLDGFVPGKPMIEIRRPILQLYGGSVSVWQTASPIAASSAQNAAEILHKKRIALDFPQAGSREPSKFEAWFYASLTNDPTPQYEMADDVRGFTFGETVSPGNSASDLITEVLAEGSRTYLASTTLSADTTPNPSYFERRMAQPSDEETSKDDHINLHTMSREGLIKIKGIGERTADRILEYRENNLILGRESLREAGISNSTIDCFIDQVCF